MKFFLIFLVFISNNIFAVDCFMPKNDLKISIDSKYRNDMTEENFNLIIDRVNNVYDKMDQTRIINEVCVNFMY